MCPFPRYLTKINGNRPIINSFLTLVLSNKCDNK